jgi:guanine deaminase
LLNCINNYSNIGMDTLQKEWMSIAISLAFTGMRNEAGGPFGAVIVKDGQIVGKGHNLVSSTQDPTAHAEIVAIRDACRYLETADLDDCVIYTSCEPCPMCLGAIYWAKISKIYYACDRKDAAEAGFEDEFIYLEINKSLEARNIPIHQISQIEALVIFEEWKLNIKKSNP